MKTDTAEMSILKMSLPVLISRAKAIARRLVRQRLCRSVAERHLAAMVRDEMNTFMEDTGGWFVAFDNGKRKLPPATLATFEEEMEASFAELLGKEAA